MPDFSDLIPFVDRVRCLLLKACMADGVEMKKFSSDTGISERKIREILFSENADIGSLNLSQIAHWFYCSVGETPQLTIVPRGPWHSTERPR